MVDRGEIKTAGDMTLANLIPVVLQISIFLLVLSIGMTATLHDAIILLRSPGKLLRMLIAINLVVPVFAVALVLTFELHRAVEIAMVAIAISPLPPFLPIKAMKVGGARSYTIGLLVAAAVLSIVLTPLTMMLLDRLSPADLSISPWVVAKAVSLSVLGPLAIGIFLHHVAPRIAEAIAEIVLILAAILLVLAVLPVLVIAWPAIFTLIGNGTIVAFAALVVVGLAAGHLIGGSQPEERTVLALASASRHPAIAVALAHANFPDDRLVLPAVLLYLLICAIVPLPYLRWAARRAH